MKIEHIAVYTNKLEELKDFYVKYFKATSNDMYHNPIKGFSSYFLTFESGARLELMYVNALADNISDKRLGFIHLAFSVGSADKVDELTNQLREDGFEIIGNPRTTGDGYYESCVKDVDGNIIEITI